MSADGLPAPLAGMQRDINCLSDPDRNTRKRGLESIKKALLGGNPLSEVVASSCLELLHRPLMKLMDDAVEKNRELALQLLHGLLLLAPRAEHVAAFLAACRGRVGQVGDVVEPSEELRLQLVQALDAVLRCSSFFLQNLDAVVHVLERAICDSFHEVRRVACGITCHVAGQHAAPTASYAKTLLKSLLTCLAHQQAKVRTAALDAISLIVKCNPPSTFEEALSGVQKLSFDRSAPVRSAVLEVCASWLHLQNLDPAPAPRLLPLLFHGVADAIPSVQSSAVKAMEDVPDPLHLAQPLDTWAQEPDFILNPQQLPPPFTQRPSPSSRATVRRYLDQLLPSVLQSMQEWTVDGRQRGVNALLCIMVYAEGALLLQLPQVVKSLAAALRDDEEGVASKAVQCSRLLGCLVPLPALTQTLSQQAPAASAAVDSWADLAAYAIAPAPAPQVLAVAPAVIDFIERCDSAAADAPSVALACTRLLHALVSGFQGSTCSCPDRLFHSLVKLISSADADVRVQAHVALSVAASALSVTVSEYVAHMAAPLLQQLVAESSSWTPKCSSLAMFCTLNRELGAGLAAHLPPVVNVLQRILSDATLEPELRARVMILLKDMCCNPALAASLRSVDRELFANAALPGCQWRHGRVSAVLRKAAVAAVESALVNGCVSRDTALEALLQHLPTWISCMDDDEPEARFTAFKASTAWFSVVASALDYETQRKLYPELLKRLDDSNDAIRVEAARAFEKFLQGMAPGFEPGQMEYMVRALCVHLDDSNSGVQDAVQSVMLQAVRIDPVITASLIEEVRPRHRSTHRCDALLAAADAAKRDM